MNFYWDLPPVASAAGAEVVAPAAGAILADTGALTLPTTMPLVAVVTHGTDDTAANIIQIAHRNAANTADVELADQGATTSQDHEEVLFAFVQTGERVVVRLKIAGTAAKTWQARVQLFRVRVR